MDEHLDLEARWPDLFEDLNTSQRRAVVQALAGAWHEGWVPEREDVQHLTDRARGTITQGEYLARVQATARRRATPPPKRSMPLAGDKGLGRQSRGR